jgi:hypothetical protein
VAAGLASGVRVAAAAAAAAAPRCMNFIAASRLDMVLGVDCFAMAGSPAAGVGGMLLMRE